MCGFIGFLGGNIPDNVAGRESLLRRMADAIAHRGPDYGGYWCDVDQNIGLGHRRLSVIDPSPAGHQPMRSSSDRYVIAFKR